MLTPKPCPICNVVPKTYYDDINQPEKHWYCHCLREDEHCDAGCYDKIRVDDDYEAGGYGHLTEEEVIILWNDFVDIYTSV